MTTNSADGFSCGLNERDLAEQAERWEAQRSFVVDRARSANGFRVMLERSRHHELAALVATERRCCGWAEWSLADEPAGVVLEVTGPGPEIAALADAIGL